MCVVNWHSLVYGKTKLMELGGYSSHLEVSISHSLVLNFNTSERSNTSFLAPPSNQIPSKKMYES